MPRDEALWGEAAEQAALAILSPMFIQVFKDQGGGPTDYLCKGLRATPRSTSARSTDPSFHFEIKSTKYRYPRVRGITSERLKGWLRLTETEPVFVLCACNTHDDTGRWSWWMLSLSDVARDRAASSNFAHWLEVPHLPHHDFKVVGENGLALYQKISAEADRATGEPRAVWHTSRDPQIPIPESTLFELMDRAPFLSPPTEVRSNLIQIHSADTTRRLLGEYLAGQRATDDPVIARWVNRVRRSEAKSKQDFGRDQFRKFLNFMESAGAIETLPYFRRTEVNCWRSFATMYPACVERLCDVVKSSARENDVMFAAAVLSPLVLSPEAPVRDMAVRVLEYDLPGRGSDFSSYRFTRELVRAPAEAGLATEDAVLRLVRRGAADDSEDRYLSGYGWTRRARVAAIKNKLREPTPRDLNLIRLYEEMARQARIAV